MTLQQPWSLLALLVLPLLWWLSLPSRPTVVAWTPHLAQWRQALLALARRPPRFSRWRFLLLAVAAVAAIVAAAKPVLPATPGPQRLVVVLDASASMAAQDASGTSAFAAATARLRAELARLPSHVDVTLLRAGGPLLRRHGASARALHDFGGPSGSLAADLPAVAAAAARDERTVVWTLTDGQGQHRLPDVGALSLFPNRGANAAVVDVRVVDAWPLPSLSVAVDVVAFAPGEVVAELRLGGACADVPARTLELASGAVQTAAFELQRTASGGELQCTVVLPGDVLPADDTWRVLLPPLPAPRIAVLADGEAGPFATAAAQALAGEVGGTVVAASSDEPVGLLLVDGGRVALTAGRVRALTFGSQLGAGPAAEVWRGPFSVDWSRSSPLTLGLDLSELAVHQAWRSVLPAGEVVLWANEADGPVPLAVVVGDERIGSVHLAFRLQDSNLPLLPAFPQLLRRAFVRSYGSGAALQVLSEVPAAGEQDLSRGVVGDERALGGFAGEERDLAPWCLLVGLCALALRAFVR